MLQKNRYLSKSNDINKEEVKISNIPKEIPGKTTANNKFAFNQIGLPTNKQQIQPSRIKYITAEIYRKTEPRTMSNVESRSRSIPIW